VVFGDELEVDGSLWGATPPSCGDGPGACPVVDVQWLGLRVTPDECVGWFGHCGAVGEGDVVSAWAVDFDVAWRVEQQGGCW
jgi:hypothetical protein